MASLPQRALNKARRIAVRKLASLSNPLRVGIIGFGGIGPDHLDGYEASSLAQVTAISDLRFSTLGGGLRRRPNLKAFQDYQQMLRDARPDVVSICTWPQSHEEIALAAAEAGVKGILCEKPVALQMQEIRRMMEVCAQKGIKLACGHQHRFNPYLRAAAAMVREGKLGKVTEVRGHIRGVLADNGPHLLDAVRFILGDAAPVSARCQCVREQGVVRQGVAAEDSASGEIVFAGGATLHFITGDAAPNFFELRVKGEKGSLKITFSSIEGEGGVKSPLVAADPGYYQRHFHEFLNWVKGKQASFEADFKHGAVSAEMMLACYESARLSTSVQIPLANEGDVIGQLYPLSPMAASPAFVLPAPSASLPADQKLAVEGGTRAAPAHFKASPEMGLPELTNLTKVILSKKLNNTEGTMVTRLQQTFCDYYDVDHAIASTSGTAALHVAMGALQLNPGDEVITTPLSDMGTVIPILACNCLPVFADIDPQSGILTAESIAQKITPKTRAIIVVHLFGRPAEMEPICALAKKHNLYIIEDCAQAHGAVYRNKKLGTFGDFGCFSLQQLKHITCGDGGVTICQNAELAEKAALFADKGWLRGAAGRNHYFLGMNYRMTELQGAVALAQMQRLPGFLESRRASAGRLSESVAGIPALRKPAVLDSAKPSWWIFDFGIDEARLGISPGDFQGLLLSEGVMATAHYLPKPLFEYDVLKYQKTYGTSRYPFSAFDYTQPRIEDFPGFTAFNRQLLIFWSHHATVENADAIANALRKIVRRLGAA